MRNFASECTRLFVFFSPAHQAGRAHLSHVQFIAAAIVHKVRRSQHIYYFALWCAVREVASLTLSGGQKEATFVYRKPAARPTERYDAPLHSRA
jgi:hypothetical protein